MTTRARFRILAALFAAGCTSDPSSGGELLVVSQIDVQPPSVGIVAGDTQQLTATPKTSSGITVPNRTVSWTASNPSVATVSATGLVSGVAAGQATVTAHVDQASADVPVTVSPKPVASVTVEPPQAEILVGASVQFEATPRDAQGQPLQDRPITFSVDDPAVASVSVTGVVTGIAPGTTTIRATSEGKTGTASVKVNPRPAARLGFASQPADGVAGVALGPVRVAVQNDIGETITVASTAITMSLGDNPGGATLAGTLTVNAVAGIATFSNLVLDRTAAGYTLRASAGPLSPALSNPFAIGAGAATVLVVTGQPAPTVASGAVLATQPVVQLRDGSGNNVPQAGIQVSAAIVGGGAALGGSVTATTDASGAAAFTNLSLSGPVGSYTLRFTAAGLSPASSSSITITPGAPSGLVIVTSPAGAVSGVPFTQQPQVQVVDLSGNAAAVAGVAVTASLLSGPGTLGGTLTATTDAAGIATFANLAITGTAGVYTLSFAAPGLQSVSVNIGLGSGLSTQLGIKTQPSSSAASGAPFAQQPVIQLLDASSTPVATSGVVITAALASGGGTLLGTLTATTDGTGKATFTNLAISGLTGNRTIQFTSGALTPVTSNVITITPGAPTQLVLTVQPSTSVSSGVAFPQQPVVQVQDAAGNNVTGLPSFPVTAAIASGSGATLGGATVVATDGNGTATFTNLELTGTSGSFTLSFSGGGHTPAVSNTITLGAGGPSELAIATPPSSSVQNGVNFPVQPVIQLQDAAHNPVAQAGVVITVTIQTGNPALGGTLNATTNASGTATFTNLKITGLVGDRTLIFAAAGYVSVTSGTITVTPGPPDALQIATQPGSPVQGGAALSPQPSIQLVDQSGNLVSQAGVNVTAAIASGGGSLGGTATVATNGSGVATFTNLSITGLVGIRTLGFTSGSLTGATSNDITVTAGPAEQLTITTQPSAAATNGTALAQQPEVQLRDGGGNPVSQSGVLITAVVGAGSPAGALTNATATTDGTGLASFSGLTITGLVGSYTLRFTSGSLTAVTSSAVVLSAGGATQLTLTTGPSPAAQNGVPFPQQPAVQLRDQSGNLVSQAGVNVTAAIISGGGTLGGTTTVATNGSGVATFTNLSITGPLGDYVLQFTGSGLSPATSGTVTLTAAPAAALSFTTPPSTTAANDVPLAQQPVIHVVDGGGNPVAGVLVSVALTGGGSISAGSTTATSDAGGDAAFSGLAIQGTAGTKNLVFSASGVPDLVSGDITLSAGAATHLLVTTQPGDGNSGSPLTVQPVVQVRDSGGNVVPVNGVNVTAGLITVNGGPGTLGGATTQPTSAGVSTFTDLEITGAGHYQITFGASGLPTVTSAVIRINP